LRPEELIKKTIEGLKEKASPFFLELAILLSRATNPKIAAAFAGSIGICFHFSLFDIDTTTNRQRRMDERRPTEA